MCIKRYVVVLGVAYALTVASTSVASKTDFVTTRALGMGNAMRASPTGGNGPLLNPAGMSMTQAYLLFAQYQHRTVDGGKIFNAVAVDSVTNTSLAAGIYYGFVSRDAERTLQLDGDAVATSTGSTTHEVGLSLSYAISPMILLGVTAKYLNYSLDTVPTLTETHIELTGLESERGLSLDVGAVIRVGAGLSLGIVGYNLVRLADPRYPRALGLGISYALGTVLLIEFDTLLDFTNDKDQVSPLFQGGAELFFAEQYALRGGGSYDTLTQVSAFSCGLGLIGRRVALEAGLKQAVSGASQTTVAVSLQASFN